MSKLHIDRVPMRHSSHMITVWEMSALSEFLEPFRAAIFDFISSQGESDACVRACGCFCFFARGLGEASVHLAARQIPHGLTMPNELDELDDLVATLPPEARALWSISRVRCFTRLQAIELSVRGGGEAPIMQAIQIFRAAEAYERELEKRLKINANTCLKNMGPAPRGAFLLNCLGHEDEPLPHWLCVWNA